MPKAFASLKFIIPLACLGALLFLERQIVPLLTAGQSHSVVSLFEQLSGKWKIILILMASIALMAIAIIVVSFQEWRTRSWSGVQGKIVLSKSVQRKVARSLSASSDEDSEMRNFADVVYSYAVDGKTLRGSRIKLAHDVGNLKVAETLARYKAGSAVTVFYNPANPTEALLERTLPAGSLKFGVGLIAAMVAFVLIAAYGVEAITELVRKGLPNPNTAPITVGLGLFALLLAGVAYALRQQAAAVANWSEVKGRIIASETETFRAGQAPTTLAQSKLLRQRVTYTYTVVGIDYQSDRISLGARTSSSLRSLEKGIVQRYPLGATVTVLYNPAHPSEAVLERKARLAWLIWASAGVLGVAAVAISGIWR